MLAVGFNFQFLECAWLIDYVIAPETWRFGGMLLFPLGGYVETIFKDRVSLQLIFLLVISSLFFYRILLTTPFGDEMAVSCQGLMGPFFPRG